MGRSRSKAGALTPVVALFRRRLAAEGYSPTSLRTKPREAAWLGRWMAKQGVAVQALSEEVVARFLSEEEAAGVPRVPRVRSFASLLAVLREEGVIAAPALAPVSPLS